MTRSCNPVIHTLEGPCAGCLERESWGIKVSLLVQPAYMYQDTLHAAYHSWYLQTMPSTWRLALKQGCLYE